MAKKHIMIKYFKIIFLMVLVIFCSCKKQNNSTNKDREFITQNINILIDSIQYFDISTLPRPEKFKDKEIKKITVGLLDSVFFYDDNYINEWNIKQDVKYVIQQNDLVNFKSDYKIKLVKFDNYDGNILFIKFSNLQINNDEASIIVKKNIGIAMIKNKYYFKYVNGKWELQKKELLSMG